VDDELGTELGPPMVPGEADLVWHAPAIGISTELGVVLLLYLALAVILVASKMAVLAMVLLFALATLLAFGLLSAAHMIGPGGVTVLKPFGTEAHAWEDFSGWRISGGAIYLDYASGDSPGSLRLGVTGDTGAIIEQIALYLSQQPFTDPVQQADG